MSQFCGSALALSSLCAVTSAEAGMQNVREHAAAPAKRLPMKFGFGFLLGIGGSPCRKIRYCSSSLHMKSRRLNVRLASYPTEMTSRTASPLPRVPQQKRGRVRVKALLDAAEAIIGDRGYEGATMTE